MLPNEIEQLRERRDRLQAERSQYRDRGKYLLSLNPADLTPALLTEAEQVRKAVVDLGNQLDGVEDDIFMAQRREAAQAARTAAGTGEVATRGVGGARVTYEARTYRPGEQFTRSGEAPSYFGDLYRVQVLNDPAAGQRLAQHAREIEVDGRVSERSLTTSGSSAFVPPIYLQDQWANLVRAGRVTADRCTKMPLPPIGMTVNIPKVTGGTSVASQVSENTVVSNTDMTASVITAPVVTIAGFEDVSRQLVERSDPGMDTVIFADLAAAYAAELDRQVVNGSGASGQMLGILQVSGTNAVAFTTGSPTPALAWPKLADAVQRINALRYAAPDTIIAAPRRWGWWLSSLDAQSRPWLVPAEQGPTNSVGVQEDSGYGLVVGTLMNLNVVTDGNVPVNLGAGTNQDPMIVARLADCILLEDNGGIPAQLRFDQPGANSLTIRLVALGYAAFTAARQPQGISIINGTGMVTPTF